MTEHILIVKAGAIEIHRQPRCSDSEAAGMFKNKLRVFTDRDYSEGAVLQIRGDSHYAEIIVDRTTAEWLAQALLQEAVDLPIGEIDVQKPRAVA